MVSVHLVCCFSIYLVFGTYSRWTNTEPKLSLRGIYSHSPSDSPSPPLLPDLFDRRGRLGGHICVPWGKSNTE